MILGNGHRVVSRYRVPQPGRYAFGSTPVHGVFLTDVPRLAVNTDPGLETASMLPCSHTSRTTAGAAERLNLSMNCVLKLNSTFNCCEVYVEYLAYPACLLARKSWRRPTIHPEVLNLPNPVQVRAWDNGSAALYTKRKPTSIGILRHRQRKVDT